MLVDTNKRDTSWEIWGHKTSAPIGFSPIGINKIYNPLGELPVAKVAKELNLPYCLSTAGSQPIEDVGAANGEGPRFFQLYMPHDDELTVSLLRRAIDSGFTACILTVEYEPLFRSVKGSTNECFPAHGSLAGDTMMSQTPTTHSTTVSALI